MTRILCSPLSSSLRLLPLVLSSFLPLCAQQQQTAVAEDADKDITWLVTYEGKALPGPQWNVVGSPNAQVAGRSLRLSDDGKGFGHYRAAWKGNVAADEEIIVEARLRAGNITGSQAKKPATSLWPWRDGAPVMVQVSDGRHQDGLVIFPAQATSFTDRFIPMDTTDTFHTYRLIIRGMDMRMLVDGVPKVEGQNAFWKPADSPEAFIQFGSSAAVATGAAHWAYVKLGVRKATGRSMTTTTPQPGLDPVKLKVSEPWLIERKDARQTRPYLYDMGKGLLLMSVAQGKDFFYEPYGLSKSTDAGKTWTPIPGLDQVDTTPLPCLRRPDGSIIAVSRWTRTQPDGRVVGKTTRLNADATSYAMEDNEIILPKMYANESPGDQTICERHIWNDDDGGMTMVVWSRKNAPRGTEPRPGTGRWSHLMRSTDEGRTWRHFSTVGPGGEPAVLRLSATEQTAVIRGDRDGRMRQTFSHDAGKTWEEPITLEVGKVLPDLVLMSNGVLACSYGRPASCLMFSLDGGRTWPSHHVISDKVGFNYTSIREISPGRLLYIHDAPKLSGLHIDVEKVEP